MTNRQEAEDFLIGLGYFEGSPAATELSEILDRHVAEAVAEHERNSVTADLIATIKELKLVTQEEVRDCIHCTMHTYFALSNTGLTSSQVSETEILMQRFYDVLSTLYQEKEDEL